MTTPIPNDNESWLSSDNQSMNCVFLCVFDENGFHFLHREMNVASND